MFQIFEKVKNLRFRRGCRAVVGKVSFSLNLTDGSLEKVARMHQFLWRFPRTVRLCWRQIGGKLLKTIGNRFKSLHLAGLWVTLTPIGQRYGKVFSHTWESFAFTIYYGSGMKHHWEWVITRLHTGSYRTHRGEVVLTTLMPIVVIIKFIWNHFLHVLKENSDNNDVHLYM